MTRHLHLAVALDGAGWHTAAWWLPSARPAELLTAGYWVDLLQQAEAGLIDFVTFEDVRARVEPLLDLVGAGAGEGRS